MVGKFVRFVRAVCRVMLFIAGGLFIAEIGVVLVFVVRDERREVRRQAEIPPFPAPAPVPAVEGGGP